MDAHGLSLSCAVLFDTEPEHAVNDHAPLGRVVEHWSCPLIERALRLETCPADEFSSVQRRRIFVYWRLAGLPTAGSIGQGRQ